MTVPTLLWLSCSLIATAETSEQLSKRFPVEPGGKLIVEVDFGTIEISTHAANEAAVEVVRRITRSSKADEEAYLAERPIEFSQEGNTLQIHSKAKNRPASVNRGQQKTEGTYKIRLPARFSAELQTDGGGIVVNDLTGDVNAHSGGGDLKFSRLHGSLNGRTGGGPIHAAGCEGPQALQTGGGKIDVDGGSGSLESRTGGGPITVKQFRGSTTVKTGGGSITMEDVEGTIDGKTAGGPITAQINSPRLNEVKLATAGGPVTLRVPEAAAFELDASTSGGAVRSDLPVAGDAKPRPSRLKGPVNGGGQTVHLRSSGGSIQVRKL